MTTYHWITTQKKNSLTCIDFFFFFFFSGYGLRLCLFYTSFGKLFCFIGLCWLYFSIMFLWGTACVVGLSHISVRALPSKK
jgi:hypothetical protein